jgi:hypothetical protein
MDLSEYPGPTWQLPLEGFPVEETAAAVFIRVRTFEHVRDRLTQLDGDAVNVHVYEEKIEEDAPPPEVVLLRTRCNSVQLQMWSPDMTYEIERPMYPDNWCGLGPAPEKTGSRMFKHKGEITTLFGLACKVFEEV